MGPGYYAIRLTQGTSYGAVFTVNNSDGTLFNFTGYSADMQVRTSPPPSPPFPTTGEDLIIELSTANGRITLGGSAGTITLSLTPSQTAALTPGRYIYDLFFTSGNTLTKTCLLAGNFCVAERVTTP